MLARLRRHLTYANVVSTLCLFIVLGGSAFAAVKITGKNVKNSSLTGADVKNSSLTGRDIKNNSLTGSDVLESKLGTVPRANNANTAGSAGSAGNADTLDGLDSSAFAQRSCNSAPGVLRGFARVNAGTGFSTTFTTAGVDNTYNCAGGTVEARRLAQGDYEVRFNGMTSTVALASQMEDGIPAVSITVGVGRVAGPVATFRVQTVVNSGGSPGTNTDIPFLVAPL
jgi:hypothetical protein